MWLLYSLKKNALGEYYEQIVSRLRPQQAYVIFRKGIPAKQLILQMPNVFFRQIRRNISGDY